MFSKLFAATAILAVATPALAQTCSTGPIQCCDRVADAQKDEEMSGILAGLGVPLGDGLGLAGTSCSPINVLAVGGGMKWSVAIFFCSAVVWSELT